MSAMTQPVVSVLMPCYNAAGHLHTALESLVGQTLTDFEIVAVNDGSTDETGEILAQWARRDRRVRILDQAHGGIIAALNAGLAVCQAEYVARMDTDDYAYPERLARQVAFLEAQREVAVVGCLVEGFPKGEVREGFKIYMDWLNALTTDNDIRREIFVESPLPHPSVIFRRSWVERVGAYQERGWPEDYDLWLRLHQAGARFAKVPEMLFAWREHPERLTRTDARYSLENFIRAKAYYLARGPLEKREAVIIWGAGMVGRRLSKHLLRQGAPLVAFVDVDPRKIGRTRRGKPIIAPDALLDLWGQYQNPVILSAVGARGARQLIRQRLTSFGLCEGKDWWCVA